LNITLEVFDESYLPLSRKWLEDSEIRNMINAHQQSVQEQKIWYDNLINKTDYLIWGIESDGYKIGACGLKNITNTECEYWGYIGEKSFWGKGAGSIILKLVEEKAKDLNIKRIWLKVRNDNERAIRLYNKCGFVYISEQAGLNLMGKFL